MDRSVSGNSVVSLFSQISHLFACFDSRVLLTFRGPVEEWESTSLSPLRTLAVWSL